MKEIMLGNEAIARGAYEAGVNVAVGYPGTPSTEILQSIRQYEGIYCEWSVNEKVAMDVAIGSSLGGAKTIVAMKHAGLNVASDPFYPISFMGVNGALVLICSDDVGAVSSPTEQDTRIYAKLFHIPMLEPSDSQEAKDFMRMSFEISEQFDTPVFFRTTNGVSHSMGVVELSERTDGRKPPFDKTSPKFRPQGGVHPSVMHQNAHNRLRSLAAFAEETPLNRIEWNDKRVGIITSGTPYQYLKEMLPEVSFLKLGLSYPLPETLVRRFAEQVEELYVIEELEPFLEEQIAALGLKVRGREIRPEVGALSVEILSDGLKDVLSRFGKTLPERRKPLPGVIMRFPTLCAGCPHLAVYYAIRQTQKKLKDRDIIILGDIGCYSLGIAAPHNMLSCAFAMGSGISVAHGFCQALKDPADKAILAYIGDSTFLHAGMPALLNSIYNQSNMTLVLTDNGTTAMTGGQEHAGTGVTLHGARHTPARIPGIIRALGIDGLHEVDPYDLKTTSREIKSAIGQQGVSVVLATGACRMFPRKLKAPALRVEDDLCTGCGKCLGIYCPGLVLSGAKTAKGKPKVAIDPFVCVGCGFCAQVCPTNAILNEGGAKNVQ
jgi:indolepyruvate ferredoxin oxidoreductase alpha subunit